MLQIAGNCAAITERSFGVPDGVTNGQFGIGLVIDFFGLAAKASGFPVEFVYPSVTAIVPANIALVAGCKNARRRASASCSSRCPRKASNCCCDPKISRLPVLPTTYAKAPAGLPESVQRHDPGEGELRLRSVRVALLRRTVAVRPDHHLPAQGTGRRDQGDPRRREAALGRPRPARPRRGARAGVFAADRRRRKPGTRNFSRFQGDQEARCRTRRKTEVEEYWSSQGARPTTPAPSSSPTPRNDRRRDRAGHRGLPALFLRAGRKRHLRRVHQQRRQLHAGALRVASCSSR